MEDESHKCNANCGWLARELELARKEREETWAIIGKSIIVGLILALVFMVVFQ